ncbi:UDP-N-acetylmuramate dehydrogenase domain protein [Bordetella holmesii 30539]|uniref:UDP-N-acetylmuramate dehydrogenase domain protein n=2 Tax=Bordetella holmesii TaxID=35814 RepID=A0ABN0S2C0_9BORD|nr:UDP-N-acetylmuramate dehydrogenase domain protein [Bordetella holmesii ATCC 51541]AIT25911.1 UDP-N-acetylmuramate dehydrogenase domain protein [Bordetella holmesii 44057]EWM43757.1 UDP-N-acetylmuramate dehydrogenase domain protein [Bordetella holmesii 41130]EWM46479.1 UDP-N-acetylmuramate dehydrogenase domain protein [Bordetella holmesii 35009]EWM50645.1 UDP-N-acetylmuramate dehydrogenase domain protein [Bordetella holmesii 70147]EXF89520.1 UDP-N-acetylmuramate dehydrogenase domain protein 
MKDGLAIAFDEMFDAQGRVRPHYENYAYWLDGQAPDIMAARQIEADLNFRRVGITFSMAGDAAGTERLIPFDLIPRIIAAQEWRRLDAGLKQRVRALNRFIHDIYHDHDIVRAGVVPAEQVFLNAQYRPEMQDIDVAEDIYCHVAWR